MTDQARDPGVLVIGGSGQAGSRVVAHLAATGHRVRGVSRSDGVDTLTGAGVAEALSGHTVIVDATAPRQDAMAFFTASTKTLLEQGRKAAVRHFVVLSVVGADRMRGSAYMRAKVAQEDLVRQSGVPFTIVRATQFHHFVETFPDVFADGEVVRVPDALLQPVAVDDVARVIAGIATGAPVNDIVDVGGPQAMTFAELIERVAPGRRVVVDARATYFGARLERDTLLPRRRR